MWCGGPPRLAKLRTRQSAPIVVRFSMTTCASTWVRGPIFTCSPMIENGPMLTPSASSAPLATRALGWMSTVKGSGLHDHGGELAFRGHLVAHHGPAGELEDVAAVADHLDRHADHVAWPHRGAEPAVVGAHEEDRLAA